MRRLSATLLLLPLIAGCDEGLVDARDGDVGNRPVGDAAVANPLTTPNPSASLDQLQVKGHLRSDWYPRDMLNPDVLHDAYRGIERRSMPRQMTVENARAFHLGFHLRGQQSSSGGALPGYEWGTHESMCANVPDCLEGLARDEPTLDWVGPVIVLLEYFTPPFFDPERIDEYRPDDLWQYGYPYEDYLYQLELATRIVPRQQVFTPDDLRGPHATLRDAVAEDGWPTLEALDGKFIFLLLDRGEVRDAYREGQWVRRVEVGPEDSRIFVVADSPEDDDAAFFSLFGGERVDEVAPLVEQGFMVHGAAEDAASVALYEQAGAQILTAVHIDEVSFAGAGRCNPATARADCYEPPNPVEDDPLANP